MITETDLSTLSLSPTNKDYYQVWEELLSTAGKISERWTPTNTNETDPGIVLLKVLTAITDKLNYNIDKSVLETFMPTAAQQESMRKLCDMMGYSMHWYRSATCEVTVLYTGDETGESISIPRFTNITNVDQDINFFTTDNLYLTDDTSTVLCMEGTLVPCETDEGSKLITRQLLDDNNRYYLPEYQIAENGIFIYSSMTADGTYTENPGERWGQVDNLNTQIKGSLVYKLGYDSKLSSLYIQFPSDVSTIIGNGVYIYYTRTSGSAGNISSRTLVTLKVGEEGISSSETSLNSDDFKVLNPSSAHGGHDIETIDEAYSGFKTTVGTFDTLVTCRDYMNFIYRQMNGDDTAPLVSNVKVTDIRDDVNRSATICEFNTYGLNYVIDSLKAADGSDRITHFDLMVYPYTTIYDAKTKDEFTKSFQYSTYNLTDIEAAIAESKTLSHKVRSAVAGELVLIKNMAELRIIVTTTIKVSSQEQDDILRNIRQALFRDFNMRNLEFGEEIPFELIQRCVENADRRIKNVSLDHPNYKTVFTLKTENGTVDLAANDMTSSTAAGRAGRDVACDLLVKNILAGRVELFNYDKAFELNFNEYEAKIYSNVTKISGTFSAPIPQGDQYTEMEENELISFRRPNFKTTITYPAYINYYLYLKPNVSVNDGATIPTPVYAGDNHSVVNPRLITANSLYQLKKGEYLYINYTPSQEEGSEEASAVTVVNKVYDEGTIIKPNFNLQASNESTAEPAKTEGFSFSSSYPEISGMYSLGPSEQIDIQEPTQIELSGNQLLVYWVLNDNRPTLFPSNILNDSQILSTDIVNYTLQEGEYFFITDKARLDMAYYGNGTNIQCKKSIATLLNLNEENKLTLETILEEGVSAVPWIMISLGDETITVQEYQYLNLGKGDRLLSITLTDSNDGGDNDVLPNKWSRVTAASYWLADTTESGGRTDLEILDLTDIYWEVKPSFILNFGPSKSQSIAARDKITLIQPIQTAGGGAVEEEATPITEGALKANYSIQTSADTYTFIRDEEAGLPALVLKNFKPYTSNYAYVENDRQTVKPLTWHNFGNRWTTVNLKNCYEINLAVSAVRSDENSSTSESGVYGLIMFYLSPINDAEIGTFPQRFDALLTSYDMEISIEPVTASDGTDDGISIYIDGQESAEIFAYSQEEKATLSRYNDSASTEPVSNIKLKYGLNIIKFTKDTELLNIKILPIGETKREEIAEALTFSDYNIVLSENTGTEDFNGLNATQLGYDKLGNGKITASALDPKYNMSKWSDVGGTEKTVSEHILEDIKEISQLPDTTYDRFYYNCLLNNSLAINFKEGKTLTDPELYYSYDNIGNAFTITEIDANFLTKGISIANSSKL